jgi:hypothetical protein
VPILPRNRVACMLTLISLARLAIFKSNKL